MSTPAQPPAPQPRSDNPLVEILIDTPHGPEPLMFRASQIHRVKPLGKNKSYIIMEGERRGVQGFEKTYYDEHVFYMSYQKLVDTLYSGAPRVDLKPYFEPAQPPGPKIGEKMPDGTRFGGYSPDDGKPMYVEPADEKGLMTFGGAQRHARKVAAKTGTDYTVPSARELGVIFNNASRIGGFKQEAIWPAAWYWSSSKSRDGALSRRFNFGSVVGASPDNGLRKHSVRLIHKGGPKP